MKCWYHSTKMVSTCKEHGFLKLARLTCWRRGREKGVLEPLWLGGLRFYMSRHWSEWPIAQCTKPRDTCSALEERDVEVRVGDRIYVPESQRFKSVLQGAMTFVCRVGVSADEVVTGVLPTDRIVIPLKSLGFCRRTNPEMFPKGRFTQRWIKRLVYFLFI